MADAARDRKEMLQGTLDLLILQTLRWGHEHGYGISQAIRAASNEVRKTSTNKQRAKYYRLTPSGKLHLASEQSRWTRLVDAVAALSKPRRQEG
jgi:PadR family transcriptional regulator PadR